MDKNLHFLDFLIALISQKVETLVIIKCDNSCQENKSWILYGNVLRFVNNSNLLPISITFDYYESGHSCMAADSLREYY